MRKKSKSPSTFIRTEELKSGEKGADVQREGLKTGSSRFDSKDIITPKRIPYDKEWIGLS